MSRLAWFAACVSIFAFTAEISADDNMAVQGTWTPTAMELGGKPFPDEVRTTIKLSIAGDVYTVSAGKATDKGTVKIDAAASPKTMDIIGGEGPNKGKTFLAIYELDGDTLHICYDLSGKTRPKEFKTAEGSALFLATYQREKL